MRSRRLPGIVVLMLAALLSSSCQAKPQSSAAPTLTSAASTPTSAAPAPTSEPPAFYFGADLSYVNEMEECGAIYLEDGEPKDPVALFQAHGANLVRARLWHNPDWTNYSTLADVKRTFTRAQEAGMDTLLDFHYSDNWADPGRQEIPAAWASIEDEDQLAEALYQYTYDVLINLDGAGLMPDFVQVGNETNSGLLKEVVRSDWPRDAKLFQAGIQAVRAAAAETGTAPRIILHVAQPENTGWWFEQAAANGITDFDVIGVSYYPQWSSFSISGMGYQANYLLRTYGKEVMVVEAGYPWTLDSVQETASNVLTQGQRAYPISPAGQLSFMQDLSQALISNGALGVVYWEPAWVSTECSTRWGQGSHWENATFFDFGNNNELLEGIDYMSFPYYSPTQLIDGVVELEYGEAVAEDGVGDALNDLPELDLTQMHVMQDTEALSFALTLSGDVLANPGNTYRVYFDTTENGDGANVDLGNRPIEIADPFKPEYALEIRILDASAAAVADTAFFLWNGFAWEESAFTGSLVVGGDAPSVIELRILKSELGNPSFVNVAALSAGRVLTRTAADVLGSDFVPAESTDPISISAFTRIEVITE